MQKLNFITLNSVDTEYSADSVEWCPHPHFQSYLACGTYQLEENADANEATRTRRKGRIYLYRFCSTTKQLQEIYRMETAAILDMKWLHNQSEDNPLLAAVNSFGQVELYEMKDDILRMISNLELNPIYDDILALSLDWRCLGCSTSQQFQILISDSKGGLNLIDYKPELGLKKVDTFSAHGFEAWTCAFDKWDINRIYSGGDDILLQAYDLRSSCRIFTNKSHNAGVTSLLSHSMREHLLLTGSYDEHLRIFDTRSMKAPLEQLNLGGGIWRLKADPFQGDRILAACMYHNFSIVQLANEELIVPTIVGEYFAHKSICYGADWCRNIKCNENQDFYIATCSFYDHKLNVAHVKDAQLF
ncbi:diphthine methyltransferase [Eurosta solidaginis]|uniref:diphthine methyltransferase n=1 Tax=Eurosta solidaginis TaxID=178769 RepID=UPI0035312E97